MTLAQNVKEYKEKHLGDLHKMRNYYRTLEFMTAIRNAASGIEVGSVLNSHQFRIGIKRLNDSAIELLKYQQRVKLCETFGEIFRITEDVKSNVYGLGDLWSYDTSLRIGFKLGIYPKEVYVQRGVKKGVMKVFGGKLPKGRSLALSKFPKEIQALKPYEAENFLCIWGRGYDKMESC